MNLNESILRNLNESEETAENKLILTKEQEDVLEKNGFGVSVGEGYIEIENWTTGGVDMNITIDTTSDDTLVEQLQSYIDNFDIDEEIETFRQNQDYKNRFTLRQSFKDFDEWIEETMPKLVKDLESIESNSEEEIEESE